MYTCRAYPSVSPGSRAGWPARVSMRAAPLSSISRAVTLLPRASLGSEIRNRSTGNWWSAWRSPPRPPRARSGAARPGTLDQRVGGQSAGNHHAGHGRAGDREQRRLTPLLLAPRSASKPTPSTPGDQFELGVALAVLARARIRRDRFGARAAELPVRCPAGSAAPAESTPGAACAGSSEALGSPSTIRQKIRSSAQALEGENFLVDPAGLRQPAASRSRSGRPTAPGPR